MKLEVDHYIYFIELTSKVTREYLALSSALSSWGITLVPVSLEAYIELFGHSVKHLVTFVNSIETLSCRKRDAAQLDRLIQWKRIHLHEISSFSDAAFMRKVRQSENYHLNILPQNFAELAKNIAADYFLEELELNKWPGKNRVRLSTI